MKKLLVMLGMVALMASACGSGSSDGDTPPAGDNTTGSSAKSMQADYELNNLAMDIASTAMSQASPALSHVTKGSKMHNFLKSGGLKTSSNITCTAGATDNTATCTISDSFGGTCTVSVTFTDTSDTAANMNMTMSCSNYKSDEDTTLDGDIGVEVVLDLNNMPEEMYAVNVAKSTAVKKAAGSTCTVEDDSTTFENDDCALSDDVCLTANAMFTFTFSVGENGFTIVDECGTYVYGSDFTMTSALCMTMPSASVINIVVSLDVGGTFNDEAVDFSDSVTCTFDPDTM